MSQNKSFLASLYMEKESSWRTFGLETMHADNEIFGDAFSTQWDQSLSSTFKAFVKISSDFNLHNS